jgi:hypothetical protein
LFVRHVFARWHIDEELTETAALLASELVTNAVQATGIVEPHPAYGVVYAGGKLIEIRLLEFEQSVVIEVWDTSLEPPQLEHPDPDTEYGRGLQLVNALSTRWGYYYTHTGGKAVWCVLSLASAEDSGSWNHDSKPAQPVFEGLQALTWNKYV